VPDRTATRLLLIARDPRTGRLRYPTVLDAGLRATLFADLILSGRIRSDGLAPVAADSPLSGDRILDAVHRAVANRANVAWPRWYRHVRADRLVLTAELVEQGRWEPVGGLLRPAFRDTEPDQALETAQHVLAVAEKRGEPRDSADAVLALVSVLCGAVGTAPRPRALRSELITLLDTIGSTTDPVRRAMQNSLVGATVGIRRARRRRFTG
jgi:Golgi phosphoprotein 3 (GPP34)